MRQGFRNVKFNNDYICINGGVDYDDVHGDDSGDACGGDYDALRPLLQHLLLLQQQYQLLRLQHPCSGDESVLLFPQLQPNKKERAKVETWL